MTDFEVDFALLPLAELVERNPSAAASWAALSEGSYRLLLGDARLLAYAPGDAPVRHAVVRLHEDLLGMLPNVLQPLPEAVASGLDAGSVAATALRLQRALEDAGDDIDEELLEACAVLAGRQLDTTYLEPPAQIWLWRRAERITVEWDHRGAPAGAERVWSAAHGRCELAPDAFVAAIRRFHERFVEAMRARLAELAATRPGGAASELARDHEWRSGRLEAALSRRADAGDFRHLAAVLAR